ncbi:hypothetical protein NQ317_006011 [Molorchus minor]|uniref:Golgin-45 n=1 Tax=Molorchus minor TaxID=1323400 RepID=A0ABQ9J3X5_9CUCU|nr:hypothetical protein NQ317_006011 [Molorchus minor]
MDKEVRTLGDGMDSSGSGTPTLLNILSPLNLQMDSRTTNTVLKSLKPVEPNSKVVYLVPKYVPKKRTVAKCLIRKQKDPKFVPYEPYKASVEPIVSKKKLVIDDKLSKNNIAIQKLVNQMTAMREAEMRKVNIIETENQDAFKLRLQWDKEKQGYQTDITNLRETNSHLENQVKFQAQVNSELKTLLVAAVGEDLETRVQHLTEDKLALARALLNSANHLTSHQEQTEWLSGQCEVWRSKFLASSLMVEELAKWKSALTNRVNDLQEVIKNLLEDLKNIQYKSLKTYNNLKLVTEKLTTQKGVQLKYGNVVEIANLNQELSEVMMKALNLQEIETSKTDLSNGHLQQTVGQKKCRKDILFKMFKVSISMTDLLQNPVTITNKQDALCNAVMGAAAVSLGGKHMYLQHPLLHGCCPHCKGDIQNI